MEPCKHDDRMIQMAADVAEVKTDVKNLDRRINGSLEKINRHISDGKGWRLAIVGVIVSMVVQVVTIAYRYGSLEKTVETIEERVNK